MPSKLLHRSSERASIARVLDRAAGGDGGGHLVVEGGPGMGRTAMLDAAAEEAAARGLRVVRAGATAGTRDTPGALAAALLATAGADDADPRDPLATDAALAAGGPSALLVDDADRADAASLVVLVQLAATAPARGRALIVTARPPLRGQLAELARDAALTLRPLPAEAVHDVVHARLPDADDALAAAVLDATAGRPLPLHALLHRARDAGEVRERLAAAPETLRRTAAARLAEAGPAAALAQAAAVLPDGAPLRLAAALAGDDAAAAADHAATLARIGLLDDAGAIRFPAPLLRAAVLAVRPAAERARDALRAAEVLRDDGAPADAIAAVLEHALPTGAAWVVAVLREAAGDAIARGRPADAVRLLRRALAEPPPSSERADVLLALGTAEDAAGDAAALDHLREAVRLAGDPELRARASLLLGRTLFLRMAWQDAAAVYEEALARDPATPTGPELAVGHAVAPAFASGALPLRHDDAERLPAGMLAGAAIESVVLNRPAAEAIDLAERAWDGGALLADHGADAPIFSVVHSAIGLAGRLAREIELIDAGLAEARRTGSAPAEAVALGYRAQALLRLGRLDAAAADARASLARDPAAYTSVATASALAIAEAERGDLAAAAATLAQIPEPPAAAGLFLAEARGRVALARGDDPAARDELARAGRIARSLAWRSPAVAPWREYLVLAQVRCGEEGAARAIAEEAVTLARAFGDARTLGVALRAAGAAAAGPERAALLREAVAALEASEARLEHAHALADLGAALRATGGRTEARTILREAARLAEACGAAPLAARVADELRAAGARRRRSEAEPGGLTPSERRVAQLAASGLTNRQVASRLYVSVKTVEKHLANAYAKLGVAGRPELADALRRAGVPS